MLAVGGKTRLLSQVVNFIVLGDKRDAGVLNDAFFTVSYGGSLYLFFPSQRQFVSSTRA